MEEATTLPGRMGTQVQGKSNALCGMVLVAPMLQINKLIKVGLPSQEHFLGRPMPILR